ncbi:hypothetical protein [uncultured Cohaesibacter sp.]|uniref:hypothetical protein n=1 Tax=uncultured Cohaesibacter sp. TaxID=1002546 RepID=UPI0029C982E3|nr:hypothetical protein [uncultured Cohaesibacter sp.]
MDKAIQVADEIIALAEEENRRLESGRPVSLEGLLVRKQKLVKEFSTFFKTYKSERAAMMLTSDSKFNALQERVQVLASSMMENASNLNRAVNANERRTNAIMRAIRETHKEITGCDRIWRQWPPVRHHTTNPIHQSEPKSLAHGNPTGSDHVLAELVTLYCQQFA